MRNHIAPKIAFNGYRRRNFVIPLVHAIRRSTINNQPLCWRSVIHCPQLIRNARKQEDRHHLFLEPSLSFPVLANDGSSIARKRKQLANGPRLDGLIREV